MQKYRKAGLLIILLAAPAFIFIFLKLFGTNHYDLPTFHPVKNPTTGEVSLSNGDTIYYTVQGLKLINYGDSALFTDANLLDKFTVAHVLPTTCGDTCLKVLTQLARVHELTQSVPQLQILSITEESTSGSDSLYNQYGMNSASWLVVTGGAEEVSKAAGEVIRLDQNIPAGMQTISLSNRLILIDGSGHIRGYYDAQDIDAVDRLMAEIKVLEYSDSLKK